MIFRLSFPFTPEIEPRFAFGWSPPTKAPVREQPKHVIKKKYRPKPGTVESPHPSMSIEYLERLVADNYVTDRGREFVKEEVDALLVKKREARAARALVDKIESVNF